jgi:hypothetical protein
MGPEMEDDGHVLCFFIAEINGRMLITIMDGLWLSANHGTYNRHYIDRLLQLQKSIATIPRWTSINIVLSEACDQWLKVYETGVTIPTDELFAHVQENDEITEAYVGMLFEPHTSYRSAWLSYMLTCPIRYDRAGSEALICPYAAALYVVGCIGEYIPYFTTTKYFDASHIFLVSEKLNYEFAASILSGFCLLSPASVQSVLGKNIESENQFLVIDDNAHPPWVTYAWAVKPRGEDRISVYALGNNEESDTSFSWKPLTDIDIRQFNTLTFLNHLLTTDREATNLIRDRMDEDSDMHSMMDTDPKSKRIDNAFIAILKVFDKFMV